MAAKKQDPPDPIQMWRDWLTKSERQMNEMFNEVMGSEGYSQTSSRMMESFIAFQKSMGQASERYLSTLNLPTRTDVLALGDRLAGIEDRLRDLEIAIRAIPGASTAQARKSTRATPPRTRKAPSKKAPSKKASPKKAAKKTGTRRGTVK